ncbi:MAG: hypothetical protein JW955_05150 [Sedimentisphaerales bacterium]|nr:hypothetical protein [Sedimentisphaerales bacterium]
MHARRSAAAGTSAPSPVTPAYGHARQNRLVWLLAAIAYMAWIPNVATAQILDFYFVTICTPTGGSVDPYPGTLMFPAPQGGERSISATAHAGYKFLHWDYSGGVSVADASAPTTSMTVSGHGTLCPQFGQIVTVTICTPTGGEVSPHPGIRRCYIGEVVTIKATPASRYTFVCWNHTGGVSVANATEQSTTMTINGYGSLCPQFEEMPCTVTVCTPANGIVSPSPGAHVYDCNSSVPISATPASGYQFVRWSTTGGVSVASSTVASTTMTVNGDGSVCPEFESVPPTSYTVTVCTPANGTVSPSPGTHVYDCNSSIPISATPGSCDRFVRWNCGGGVSVVNSTWATTTMTVSGDGSLCPQFEKAPCAVTICTPTNGTASPSPGYYTYDCGSSTSISATPASGYHFVRWSTTGGVSVASFAAASTTMTVNNDGSVCPVFDLVRPTSYTVTVCTPTNGTVSPTPGVHSYNGGSSVPISAAPASGYQFVRWSITGGVSVASSTAASTTMTANADGSLCPEFEKARSGMGGDCYVDAGARGRGDGSSWVDAFNYLQEALAVVQAGQTIWMAEGVYAPDRGTGCTCTLGDREISFMLVSGVAIVGGFPAGGGTPQQRNPDRHQTILSGDIGLLGSITDNSCHVVMAVDCSNGTILDGLTIACGNASGSLGCGAGLQITSSTLSVVNCTFTGNVAASAAGVCCQSSEVEFTNCVFTGNTAELVGGAVGIWDCAQPVFLVNCTFSGNAATTGGAVYASTSVSAVLANSILWGNVALQGSQITLGDSAVLTVAFCDVQGGRADVAVGRSTLLWGAGNLTSNPSFADADGADDLAGTLDDRLDLLASSPCVDAGDDTLVSLDISDMDADGDTAERVPLDLAGNPRFLNGLTVASMGVSDPPDYTAIVDLGAYELRTQR